MLGYYLAKDGNTPILILKNPQGKRVVVIRNFNGVSQ